MLPLTFAMSIAMHNSAQTSSYLIPGQHYVEAFMPLSYSNQDFTFMGDYIIPVHKQQTRLLLYLSQHIIRSDIQHCLDYSDAYSAQTFSIGLTIATHIPLRYSSIALTVVTHILLRHLAAIIPSQLNNYFLPSYETCSIKVPFILAAIKPS